MLTKEKSEEQAIVLKKITELTRELDIVYLEEALKAMKKNHSFRESAAVLNPNPFIHHEQQELNEIKIDQLECFLRIAKNIEKIMKAGIELGFAKQSSNQLAELFK